MCVCTMEKSHTWRGGGLNGPQLFAKPAAVDGVKKVPKNNGFVDAADRCKSGVK